MMCFLGALDSSVSHVANVCFNLKSVNNNFDLLLIVYGNITVYLFNFHNMSI